MSTIPWRREPPTEPGFYLAQHEGRESPDLIDLRAIENAQHWELAVAWLGPLPICYPVPTFY